jgi:hypothetical protein
MISTRANRSALLKSKVDHLEYRLRELEAAAAELRSMLQAAEASPPLSPSYLSPHPRSEPRSPRLPFLKKALPLPVIKLVKVKALRRSTKFTPEALAQIEAWVGEGLSREQIAERLGTTLGSLQVSCSRKGVSLWAKNRARKEEEVA